MINMKKFIFILFIGFIFCFHGADGIVFAGNTNQFIKKQDLKKININAQYPKNYIINCLVDGGLMRWHHTSFPLRVYIKDNDLPSYFNNNVKKAFQTWQNVSGGLVSFRYVNDEKQADVLVYFRKIDTKSKEVKTLGYTTPRYLKKKMYKPVEICLTPYNNNTVYMSSMRSYSVALHEIGHALGLGHSKNINDIMYPTPVTTNGVLSKGDINTLKLLYSVIPYTCDKPYGVEYTNTYATIEDILYH